MTRFSIKEIKKIYMALKCFILPENYFKANIIFAHYDPPPPPITHPLDYPVGDTKSGEGVS